MQREDPREESGIYTEKKISGKPTLTLNTTVLKEIETSGTMRIIIANLNPVPLLARLTQTPTQEAYQK